jgi:peptidoglycan/LPS O-acetylase OafA/YrhL
MADGIETPGRQEVASAKVSDLRPAGGRVGRLPELDGWRAISVLLVIQSHFLVYQHTGILSRHARAVAIAHNGGALGVKIFFVISGFVICRLLIAEESHDGSVSLKAFYYRRMFRILPPFLVYLGTISLLLCAGLIADHWSAILGAAVFTYDIHLWPFSWFVGHLWSLAVEEQFYVTFPVIFLMTPKRWRSQMILGIFCMLGLWHLFMAYTEIDFRVSGETLAGFGCICCGVFMAIHEAWVRRMAGLAPALVIVSIVFALSFFPVVAKQWQSALYENWIVPPAIGLMLLFSLERGPLLRAFLRSAPAQAVGITSYGVYLWQQLFTAPRGYFPIASWAATMLLPLLFLVVPLSYYWIEKPAMRYGQLLSRRARESRICV